ncbi:MAG TPA: hypothetical protein VEZ20_06040 [Allosphingosinicella sp.]|jgi:hypothetical protein|nr:hypothetical protein [Allosphingosinicella sp.]
MPNSARAELDPRYLWIAAAPAAIFTISAVLVSNLAAPVDTQPFINPTFDIYNAAAARTGVLAATMLLVGACLGSIGYFIYRWRLLDTPSRWWTLLAYAALALGASSIYRLIEDHSTTDYAGQSLACYAATAGDVPPRLQKAPVAGTQTPEPQRIQRFHRCGNELFKKMDWLAWFQGLAVVLAFSALVCGALSTLAARKRDDPSPNPVETDGAPASEALARAAAAQDQADLQYWEEQSEALNAFLYLGALLLATALLFINAFLRWPTFVLAPSTSLESYLSALVSYYGFTFSVMLGAFYIPAALVLSRKVRARKPDEGDGSSVPAAFKGPLQALKIVLAISSTAIAGALPDILGIIA